MTFEEFIAIITSDFADALDEEKASAFIVAADIDTLHAALHTPGIKNHFASLINKSLGEKIAKENTDAAMHRIASKVSVPKGPK
jgi:hypothetical protein